MTGDALWEAARALLDVPFGHGGRSRLALDCIGLILLPAWELGLTDYQPRNYSPQGEPVYLLECLTSECDSVAGPPQIGDIGWFAPRREGNHLGYLNGQGQMIHSNRKAGRVCETLVDDYWQSRLLGVWRWKALCKEERSC